MKKALGFAVALGLVAGMASSAMAEDMLSINGDARWRGVYMTNATDGNDDATDKVQKMDQRYRLVAKVQINDDVKITSRIVLSDQEFGNDNAMNHYVDRANMAIKAFDGTVTIGRMNASWGNKFLGWGNSVDRLKYVTKKGDTVLGAYLQKSVEGNQVDGDGDLDVYAALIIQKMGDLKWGVLANYVYDDRNALGSDGGQLVDVFLNVKAGAASIVSELAYFGGDTLDNPTGDAFYGGFVGATMPVGSINAKGLVAFYDGNMGATGGRDCDNDFAPTLLIGTCNETAIIDFGQTTQSTDDSTYLITVGADMKVDDKLTVGATLGYLMASEEGGVAADSDASITEVDVWLKYALAQNVTYSLGIAYGANDDMFTSVNNNGTLVPFDDFTQVNDDAIFVIGNRINVKW